MNYIIIIYSNSHKIGFTAYGLYRDYPPVWELIFLTLTDVFHEIKALTSPVLSHDSHWIITSISFILIIRRIRRFSNQRRFWVINRNIWIFGDSFSILYRFYIFDEVSRDIENDVFVKFCLKKLISPMLAELDLLTLAGSLC